MKKNRLIFYSIFAFFQLGIFLFSVYMDVKKEDYNLLLSLLGKIWMLKYGAFIGLVLLGVDIVWLMKGEKDHETQRINRETEMNNLKAKLYDLQEAAKKQTPPPVSK